MCSYLANLGFRPIDLCGSVFRKKDLALWQLDLFSVRADRPEFKSRTYQ